LPIVLVLLCFLAPTSSAVSSPAFLGHPGSRAQFERKFLNTSFCKAYRCALHPQQQQYSVFKLKNALEVWMDPWGAGSLLYNLGKPHRLSTVETVMLEALIKTATGKAVPFDLRRNCSSVAAIRRSKPTAFKLSGSTLWLGEIQCGEDTTGIPKGQINTAPEFVPSYYFSIYFPV